MPLTGNLEYNECVSLFAQLVVSYFEVSGFSVSDFIEGVLIGLSLGLNLVYLMRAHIYRNTSKARAYNVRI